MNESINLPDASGPTPLASSLSTTTALSSSVLTPDNAPEGVKRGRKPETPARRLERLQREVAAAKIKAKDAERRMFAVVGEALLREAEADAQLRARLLEILRRRVTGAQARADIAPLLAG